ncbi:MAG: DUF6580 family putative transport protein [Fuerstiella sp.]
MSASPNPDSVEPVATAPLSGSRKLTGSQQLVLLGVCLITVGLRLIDLPIENLSTMAALALFCGSVLRHPAAVLVPLVVRVITDSVVHWNTGYGFFVSWPFDYSAYALIFLIGWFVQQKRYDQIMAGAFASIIVYFLLSNFGVWLMWPDTYARSLVGLTDCFTMAIPFARGTALGNLLAAPAFFMVWNLVTSSIPAAHTSSDASLVSSDQ